ncbi:DUF3857 domain-containing protein [Apibacter raozihei]|uniref:DUF3857 domain-containing protein n=1 Tax=Apibacter raozihei TaxID=2500547 RepID=UPI000FE2A8BB|nr:DUF3857 domain-containing protein [Apibacter raozihei]
MEPSIGNENYKIGKPSLWARQFTDDEIKSFVVDSEFSRKWLNEGRDFCYLLDKVVYASQEEVSEYCCVIYTLNESANLDKASIYEVNLDENEEYVIHRISVIREGQLIDKIPDLKIKEFDDENNSGGGVISSAKKINITIKDLRLYDVLILEDTKRKILTDKDFIKKEFFRYIWVSPDLYWAYGQYKFTFINECEKTVEVKKNYFRNKENTLESNQIVSINKGEKYEFYHTDYLNSVDSSRQIFPFIDLSTQSTWQELSNYIYPFYKEVYEKKKLEEYAPELVEKLNLLDNKDKQLQFAIDYVQNNINYIFNAVDMNGHKPQEPEITYFTKQGDCKAKCVLLKNILDYLDIESSVILINYNVDFYFRNYLPSLLTFNHVIVKVNYKGEEYFIDATTRDEYGTIENRGFLYFKYYLEINPDQDLKTRTSHKFKKYCIEETVEFKVSQNKGNIIINTKYWGNRANMMRKYFKNTNKREVIDSWNNFLFYTLNYVNDRKGTDPRKIFTTASIDIINDDKDANEFKICYQSDIADPYYVNSKNNRFLMYFDYNIVKNQVRDYVHEDIPFWIGADSEKYEISIETDVKIDTKEKYTIQEVEIHNKYLDYTCKKNIRKNGGTVTIESNVVTNLELKPDEFESYRKDHETIADSNFGLGLDIVNQGFMNGLFSLFKK